MHLLQNSRSYLKDNNNPQQKAGEDVHKNLEELKNKNVIAKDSTQRDDFKRKLYSPDAVYGSDLFKSNQITELSELSTPPLDYPIGVGDHIVVSLWGGADFEAGLYSGPGWLDFSAGPR